MLRAIAAITTCFLLFQNVHAAEEAPASVAGAKTVNAAEAKALYDKKAMFLDARSNSDWEAGRIAGAVHLELKSALTQENLAKHAKPGDSIVFYCNGPKCMVSANAIEKVKPWGYTKLFYMRDGFPAWKAANYPVE